GGVVEPTVLEHIPHAHYLTDIPGTEIPVVIGFPEHFAHSDYTAQFIAPTGKVLIKGIVLPKNGLEIGHIGHIPITDGLVERTVPEHILHGGGTADIPSRYVL